MKPLCLVASLVTFCATASPRLSVRPQSPEALLLHKWSKLTRRNPSVIAACASSEGAVAAIACALDNPGLDTGQGIIQNHTETDPGEVGYPNDGNTGALQAPGDALRHVSINDLRIGSLYRGKVTAIESYGAFVDIGAYFHGFVHISRLGTSFVRRAEDVLQVGQDVTVQIVDLDLHANHMSLFLRPDEGFEENFGLQPLPFSMRDLANRAAVRRANKLARRAQDPLPRRSMSLETRRRLKAYRRTVLAERHAMELYRVKTKARSSSLGAGVLVENDLKLSSDYECGLGDIQNASSSSPKGVSTTDELKPTIDDETRSDDSENAV